MRIGIDGTTWNNNRGFGRFTRELLGALFADPGPHDYVFLTDTPPAGTSFGPHVETVRVRTGRSVIEAATADSRRSIRDMLAFRRAAQSADLDVLFFPAVYSWFPPPRGPATVVTFHDAIAEHFPELVFPHWRQRFAWNAKTWAAKRLAQRVLTVSQTAKAEIVEYLHIPATGIDVICEGVSADYRPVTDPAEQARARAANGLPATGRLLMYVGGFAPHKNLERLFEAFDRALSEDGAQDLILVMTGDPKGGGFHSIYAALQARMAAAPRLAARVRFPGYVSDKDLAALHSQALALILPSLSEGFGLPALEAMSCGTPVLGTAGGAVLEVAGKAGLGFDPLSVPAIAAAITRLARDTAFRGSLAGHAIAETARNTWPLAAQLTRAALERAGQDRVAANRRRPGG